MNKNMLMIGAVIILVAVIAFVYMKNTEKTETGCDWRPEKLPDGAASCTAVLGYHYDGTRCRADCTTQAPFKTIDDCKAQCEEKPTLPVYNEAIIQGKIKSKLVGQEITYSGKQGVPEKYVIKKSDFKSISKELIDNKLVWKVRIGEAMAWDYYFDETGENIIEVEQVFKT